MRSANAAHILRYEDEEKPTGRDMKKKWRGGFTLIELSMVLVVIGLIVSGILTGQSLIAAAAARAQITQIEKFNQAANTFREKYSYLPGDIPAIPAAQFGFAARGQYAGQGDGNGLIEGNSGNCSGCNAGTSQYDGETTTFWNDLSTANLIEGSFIGTPNTGNYSGNSGNYFTTSSQFNTLWPTAKLGTGNYVLTFSSFSTNKFEVMNVTRSNSAIYGQAGISVAQAYSIDAKIDDGAPTTGNVTAVVLHAGNYWINVSLYGGAPGNQGQYSPNIGGGYTAAASPTSCFDNGANGSAPFQYSMSQNNGAGINCALAFRMQAGD